MFKRILIVVDTVSTTQAAAAQGAALAKAHAAHAVLVTVLPRYTMPIADMPVFSDLSQAQFEKQAREAADNTLARAEELVKGSGVSTQSLCVKGDDEVTAIIEAAQAQGCELIVVEADGHNAVVRLLTGSVIPGLITASPLPLFICKAPQT